MFIYKLTSPTGKVYIGKAVDPQKRWSAHQTESKRSRYQTHLYRAIRLYGWDNFQKEIIDTAETKEEANQKEIYWISFYHSFEDHEKGGDGGKTLPRPWNYGKKLEPLSEGHKEKVSKALKERYSKMPHPAKGQIAWNKGQPSSEETKQKLRKAMSGREQSIETRGKRSKSMMGKNTYRRSKEHRQKIKDTLAGKPVSEETKIKMSKFRKEHPFIIETLQCPHCGKIGKSKAM